MDSLMKGTTETPRLKKHHEHAPNNPSGVLITTSLSLTSVGFHDKTRLCV